MSERDGAAKNGASAPDSVQGSCNGVVICGHVALIEAVMFCERTPADVKLIVVGK